MSVGIAREASGAQRQGHGALASAIVLSRKHFPNGRLHRVVFYLARDPSGSSTGEANPCPFQQIRLRNTPRCVSNWPENPTLPMFAPACRILQGNGYWPAYKRGRNETSSSVPAAELLDLVGCYISRRSGIRVFELRCGRVFVGGAAPSDVTMPANQKTTIT